MFTPIRISSATPCVRCSASFTSARRCRIPSAARSARAGSSSCAIGTPNTAITASPMNFSTVPPSRLDHLAHRDEVGVEHLAEPLGIEALAEPVDPVTSANRTVTSFRSAALVAAGSALAAAPASVGAPHAGQNMASAGSSRPHDRHTASSALPQAGQKRAPAATSAPQFPHFRTDGV